MHTHCCQDEQTIHLSSTHTQYIGKAGKVLAYTQMALPPIHLQRVLFSLISYRSFRLRINHPLLLFKLTLPVNKTHSFPFVWSLHTWDHLQTQVRRLHSGNPAPGCMLTVEMASSVVRCAVCCSAIMTRFLYHSDCPLMVSPAVSSSTNPLNDAFLL